jgi:hypothetical protein
MERVLTSILRIASVSQPQNVRLALAAQIFVAAGVLILFVINIIFAMRLVRATHRSFGWHPAFGIAFKSLFVLVGVTLIMVITATVQGSYTLSAQTRATDRSLQLYGSTLLAIVATLPLLMTVMTLMIPYSPIDEFGTGRLRTKVITLLISTTLLLIGAWYRCGITWQTPVPRFRPLPGYLGKGPFYILNFLFEFQTVIMYAVLRVDQRWHIPNGASGPGSYSHPPQRRPEIVELQISPPSTAHKTNASIDSIAKSTVHIDFEVEKLPPLPRIAQNPHHHRHTLSQVARNHHHRHTSSQIAHVHHHRHTSSQISLALSSHPPTRPTSRRQSLLQQILNKQPTPSQKREWRASEESRIIRRLGGPWSQLPSPTESAFSMLESPTRSVFSGHTGISADTGVSFVNPPSIRDTLHEENWTPEIDFDIATPQRWKSLRKRSLDMLRQDDFSRSS